MSQTKAQLLGPLVADDISVTGGLNLDNGTLKVDPATNRVGINNANPTKTLDVGGDGQLSDLYLTADYPTIRPSLDLAFAQTRELDSRITFTRSSTATFVNRNGIIETAAVNTPRFDHDPITGESLGLLIEESRTNLLTYSEGYNTGGWSLNNSTMSSNATTSPDGATNGFLLTENTASSGHFFNQTGITLTASTTYTFSAFVKRNGRDVVLQINNGNNPLSVSLFTWNLSNGTYVGSSDVVGIAGLTNKTGTITAYPNGWYRITATFISGTSTTGGSTFYIEATDNASVPAPSTPSYTGNGTSGFYVWGAQVEQGTFVTSYIPTTTSSVTRSSDLATMSGTNLSSWYNSLEGTAFIESYMKNFNGAVGIPSYGFKSTSNSNYYYGFSRDNINPFIYVNTSDVNNYLYGTLSSTGFYKSSLGIKQNSINSYINGVQNYNTTTATLFTPDILYIGGGHTSSNILNGHVRRFVYYPRRLNNSQLQNITL